MATVNQPQDEEQQGNQGTNSSGSSSPTSVASATPTTTSSSTGGSSAPGGAKVAPQSQAQSYNPQAATSSNNFTNLKSYLNANNNGQDFSNQVNTNLNQQGTSLQNNIQGASNQFNNQVQSVVNPVQQNYQAYQNIAANNDPNAIVNYANQGNNTQNIQNLENATYTGPKSLNDLSGNNNGSALQSGISNYQNLANDTKSEAGRMNLLQGLYGNQNYGQGQQTLDNVFLQGNNFGNTLSQANQLGGAYNTAANNATTSAQNAANTVNQAATGTQNSLNAAVGNQYQNVQGEVQQDIGKQQSSVQNFINNYNNGNISAADAKALGITSGADTYNLDPTQFVSKGNTPTVQNVATAQDYSNFNTLQSLLGNNANTQNSGILSNFQDPSQAGKLGDLYNLNQQAYQNLLGSQKDAYQQAVNPVQQQLDNLNVSYNNSPSTYSGSGGNGYLGALNSAAGVLKSSGFGGDNAANMTNEQLVQLAEQNPSTLNSAQQSALASTLGNLVTTVDPNYFNTNPNSSIEQSAEGGPYLGNDLKQASQWAGSPVNNLTGLVDAWQQQIASKQAALQQLANQYGANKSLNIGSANS